MERRKLKRILGIAAMVLGSLSAYLTVTLAFYHPWSTVACLALAGAGYDLTFD